MLTPIHIDGSGSLHRNGPFLPPHARHLYIPTGGSMGCDRHCWSSSYYWELAHYTLPHGTGPAANSQCGRCEKVSYIGA